MRQKFQVTEREREKLTFYCLKKLSRESYRPFRDTFSRKRKLNRQKVMVWGQKIMGDFTKGSCRAINTAVVQLVLDFAKESPSILINWFNELFFMELRPKSERSLLLNGVCNVIKYPPLGRRRAWNKNIFINMLGVQSKKKC